MENPEKLATYGTQDTGRMQTEQNHYPIYVGHHFTQTNTKKHKYDLSPPTNNWR